MMQIHRALQIILGCVAANVRRKRTEKWRKWQMVICIRLRREVLITRDHNSVIKCDVLFIAFGRHNKTMQVDRIYMKRRIVTVVIFWQSVVKKRRSSWREAQKVVHFLTEQSVTPVVNSALIRKYLCALAI